MGPPISCDVIGGSPHGPSVAHICVCMCMNILGDRTAPHGSSPCGAFGSALPRVGSPGGLENKSGAAVLCVDAGPSLTRRADLGSVPCPASPDFLPREGWEGKNWLRDKGFGGLSQNGDVCYLSSSTHVVTKYVCYN